MQLYGGEDNLPWKYPGSMDALISGAESNRYHMQKHIIDFINENNS